MLWSTGDSPRALFLHLLLDLTFSAPRMGMRRVRGQSNNALQFRGFDEFGLTLVPFCQDLCRRRASKLTGMDDAGESDMGYVARCGIDSFKIPYSLGTAINCSALCWTRDVARGAGVHSRVRVNLVEKATSVVSIKHTSVSPKLIRKWLQVNYFNHEHISRLRAGHLERSRQVMDLCEIDVSNIISVIVVLDLASGPVYAFNVDDFSILDCAGRWYYGEGD